MPLAPQQIRTCFVTTVTASRRRLFQVERNARLLIEILEAHRNKGNLALHGYVVMPDHVHLLLTPAPNVSLEKVMQFIKGGFSFQLRSKLKIWERSFDNLRITDASDFNTRLDYIHENPVRSLAVNVPELYPFSSAAPRVRIDPIPAHFIE